MRKGANGKGHAGRERKRRGRPQKCRVSVHSAVTYTNFHWANLNMHESEKVGSEDAARNEAKWGGRWVVSRTTSLTPAEGAGRENGITGDAIHGGGREWISRITRAIISSFGECRRIGIPGEIVEHISAKNAEEIDVSERLHPRLSWSPCMRIIDK